MSFFSIKKSIVLFGLVSLIFVFSFKEAEAACNTAPSINTNPIPLFGITDTAGSELAYIDGVYAYSISIGAPIPCGGGPKSLGIKFSSPRYLS